MKIEIQIIDTKKQLNKFINFVYNLYKNDPNFVAPLKFDRKKLLNKKKNPFFDHSEMELFIALVDGEIKGRIGAIVNHNHNKTHNDKVGFFGFFECVNDQTIADKLFKKAEDYLTEKGMRIIRGPLNPSLNDENALLVDGFDSPPVVLMSYNPRYYIQLIESYGFIKAKDTYAFKLINGNYEDDKIKRLKDSITNRYDLTIRSVNFKNKIKFRKDVKILKNIYNSAWEPNWGFVKMTDEEFNFLASDLKTIADPDYTLIAESKGKAVGFLLGLPNINQSLIHNRSGNLLPGAFHLLTKKNKIEILRIIVLGIIPEFQKKGIDALLYHEIGKRSLPKGIKFGEASWILEDNEMMIKGLTSTMKSEKYKTYRIYEKNI